MIYCTVLTGQGAEPAQTFIQATSRFVCLSDLEGAVLAVSVERPAFMQVKIDEEVVLGVQVTSETKRFDLKTLLARPKKKSGSRLGFLALRRSLLETGTPEEDEGPATAFTVMLYDGDGPTARLFATYEFELLDPQVFHSRYAHHFELVERTVKPVRFTTDARSPDTALDCWNCGSPVRAGGLCRNCGCSQNQNGGDGL